MDRLHLQLRAVIGLLLLGLTSSVSACSDELIEIPERLRGEPACAWVNDSHVHFADGQLRVIYDEQTHWTGAGCLCLTEEEFESGSRLDELNERALEVCNQLAAQYDFDWSECEMDYASARWLDFVYWSRGSFEHPQGDALGCMGE